MTRLHSRKWFVRIGLAVVLVGVIAACSGGNGTTAPDGNTTPTPPPVVTIEFSALVLALADIRAINPLGNLNPPGHTFPSDHIGFGHLIDGDTLRSGIPVYAPAAGYIRAIYRGSFAEPDDGIEIGPYPVERPLSEQTWYFMGHLILDAGFDVGSQVTAGQRLGTNSRYARGIDLGIVDTRVTNPFIRIERYGNKMAHGVSPLSRYTQALHAQLTPLVEYQNGQRRDSDGKFVYDIPSRLQGNWFHESLPYQGSAETSPANWSKHLSFVEDAVRAGDHVIVTGGYTTGESTVYSIPPTDPDFATVSASSGPVLFRSSTLVLRWYSVPEIVPNRWFLVEMTGPETLKFEMFSGATSPTEFTAAAAVFKR